MGERTFPLETSTAKWETQTSLREFPEDALLEKLLTKPQLAEWLGVSQSYINKLMALGDIPYVKFGRTVRFQQVKILAWLQRRSKP